MEDLWTHFSHRISGSPQNAMFKPAFISEMFIILWICDLFVTFFYLYLFIIYAEMSI